MKDVWRQIGVALLRWDIPIIGGGVTVISRRVSIIYRGISAIPRRIRRRCVARGGIYSRLGGWVRRAAIIGGVIPRGHASIRVHSGLCRGITLAITASGNLHSSIAGVHRR